MPRKATTLQFDLFSSSRAIGIAQPPRWQTLPAPTRQLLTPLLARMLLDHADGDSAATWETGDDL